MKGGAVNNYTILASISFSHYTEEGAFQNVHAWIKLKMISVSLAILDSLELTGWEEFPYT